MQRTLLAFAVVILIARPLPAGEGPPKGFESLFNGKDLAGWKSTGDMKVWGAENGVIFCQGGGGGWLLTEKVFGDFELRLEYKMPQGGNSGVGIRSPLKGDPAYVGMEIQLIDDEGWPGGLQKWQNTGAIYNVVPPSTIKNKPIGEWNEIKITALGTRITVVNNGATLVDADLDKYIIEHSKKHPGILRQDGHVGFQSYNKRVEFRNIYVKPLERRTAAPKHYDFKYFPWTPPASKEAWEARRPILKEQLLVSQGLWPMPEKAPLNAVIHGKIERDGYTVEKVFFASHPGHYVTGNLYRPTSTKQTTVPVRWPAVLYTHGHWQDARLSTANGWSSDKKSGAEATEESSKYFHQAGCAMLARLGCVVFHYDMVGNSDSMQIAHRQGFKDVDAQLRLQTFMNLQTWNSIRAVDFVTSLPDVDPGRIGITGASGGGTQSFILAACDDRIAAAFPAVMISTSMQGGCICENCAYLRVGTTNIELAALIAPRPLGMTAANDWTKELETKGLPELKAIYKLYGVPDNVMAKYLNFGHNYNQPSREVMYNFFNKHLKFGVAGTITEKPFAPIDPKQLSVYDAKHPLPKDAGNAETLKATLTAAQEKQLQALMPKDKAGLAKFQAMEHAALRAMMTDQLPSGQDVEFVSKEVGAKDAALIGYIILTRKGQGERLKLAIVGKMDTVGRPKFNATAVIWVHPEGINSLWKDGKLVPAARAIIDKGVALIAIDVFRAGAAAKDRPTTNMTVGQLAYAGYFYGYNRALVAERVHDILTAVAFARGNDKLVSVHLVGFEKAGPWVVLARGLCGDAVERTAADLNGFRFENVKDFDDEMMLPGALRYGGLLTLAATIAPHELYLHNAKGAGAAEMLRSAYQAAGQADRLHYHAALSDEMAVAWLLR